MSAAAAETLVPRRIAIGLRDLALAASALLALIVAAYTSLHTFAAAPENAAAFHVDSPEITPAVPPKSS